MQFERRAITQTINIPTNANRTVDEHVQAYLDRAATVMDSMGISMWPAVVSNPGAEGGDDALDSILDGYYWCGRVWEGWQVGTMTEDDFSPAGEEGIVADLIAWRNAAVAKAIEELRQARNSDHIGD